MLCFWSYPNPWIRVPVCQHPSERGGRPHLAVIYLKWSVHLSTQTAHHTSGGLLLIKNSLLDKVCLQGLDRAKEIVWRLNRSLCIPLISVVLHIVPTPQALQGVSPEQKAWSSPKHLGEWPKTLLYKNKSRARAIEQEGTCIIQLIKITSCILYSPLSLLGMIPELTLSTVKCGQEKRLECLSRSTIFEVSVKHMPAFYSNCFDLVLHQK